MAQQVYLGQSSIGKLPLIFQKVNPKRIFLVRGKDSYTISGARSILASIFLEQSYIITEFCDFEKNPKIEDVISGLALLKKNQYDLILAIGGGSVLDMAKLIRFFYSYSGNITGPFRKEKDMLPLIVLPTTAGTGSETTHFAVLYKENVKYSVSHNEILPDIAIIDPIFTYNNSKYLTACTGFDALSQALEAYWNVNATIDSDRYAEKAIRLLIKNLPLVVNHPTCDLRNKMVEGAYWAGRAINLAKTTAPHAFSYSFTTYCGYPHGHAVALTFPFFFRLNTTENSLLALNVDEKKYKQKMDYLNEVLECNINWDSYLNNLGLFRYKPIKDVDTSFLLDQVNIERLTNNPVIVTENIKLQLLNYLEP